MKRGLIVSALCCLAIVACNRNNNQEVRVGTISGPETEIMEVAQKVAADEYHLNIKIVPFADYVMPNTALNDGSIDANVYQHQPYLDAAVQAHNYQFSSLGKTFIYPMALYSKRHKTLAELPDKAVVAIPNDPSNESRALLLLDKAGLIKLKDPSNFNQTTQDIVANPKNLVINELDAAQLPRSLDDVDLAAVNTNYAFSANLLPNRDSLFAESKDSPYANIIVVRTADKDKPALQLLVKALQSPAVVAKAEELFKGQAIAAFTVSESTGATDNTVKPAEVSTTPATDSTAKPAADAPATDAATKPADSTTPAAPATTQPAATTGATPAAANDAAAKPADGATAKPAENQKPEATGYEAAPVEAAPVE